MKTDITIFCLTYNHVGYIKDALEGFLNQKTQYNYDIFVYDDASTDGTSEILREYKDKYPDLFKIYISERNLYKVADREAIMMNLYRKYIQGKYVAWCEGDDYWIDSNKLQMQVQYMEAHPECSMTAHGSVWLDCQINEKKNYLPFNEERDLTAEEIILQPTGNLSTASLVMRREIFMRDDRYPRCGVMDRPLQMYALCHGKIHFFPFIMSVYRYMHQGSWSMEMDKEFDNIILHCYDMVHFLEMYNQYTHMKYNKCIRKNIISYMDICIYRYLAMGVKDYREKCIQIDNNIVKEYGQYLKRQCELFEWIKGSHIMSRKEKEKIQQSRYIVIMGIGDYSRYVEQVFAYNKVLYVGYVVTSNEKSINKKKTVWELRKYPYEKKSTLVVVGIHQRSEESVLQALQDNEFDNYITPLWLYEGMNDYN